jgi:TonB family protein
MKEKNENKNSALSEFQRYIRGEMTKREENAFQRKLQRDPFADEAAEGYSGISPREAADDIGRLVKKLKYRIRGRQRIVFYRIAASIAVLMILSSVYLIIRQTRPADKIRDLSSAAVPANVQNQEALNKSEDAESIDNMTLTEEKSKQEGVTENPDTGTVKSVTDDKEMLLAEGIAGEAANPEKKDSVIYIAQENQAAPAGAISITEQAADTGKMLVNAQPPTSELSEVAMVVYGAKKSAVAANAVAAGQDENAKASYTPPQPVNGQDSFNRYIEENIQKPDSLASGQRAEVVVNFIVRSSGSVDSIKVISSPGLKYSDEAVRLIKGGPAWRPASQNGEMIDDEVRVRIVFK